jgi:ADP-heptose:LPS heptosyltransferase
LPLLLNTIPKSILEIVIEEPSKNKIISCFGGGKRKNFGFFQTLNVINIAEIKFKQELELISNLDVMLSMDSGNGHIAAMLGVSNFTALPTFLRVFPF